MRGLIACFAVVCLALASGAPSEKQKQVHTKSFDFEKKEVIYSSRPISKNELVYAVCEGADAEKKCKVYVETSNQGESTVKSCDLALTYQGRFDWEVALANAGNSRAVVAVKDGQTKIKLISVNLNGCKVGEASVDVPRQITKEATPPLHVAVVGHADNYDIVYHDKEVCGEKLCKATFSYDGKLVKAPATFPIKESSYTPLLIEYINNIYIVGESNLFSTAVSVVDEKEQKSNSLFSGKEGAVGVSTEENKVSFCAYSERKTVCKQYEADGKTKKLEFEIQTGEGRIEVVDVLNLEKGLLVLSAGRDAQTRKRSIFVQHINEQGKEGKFVNVDLKCDDQKVVLPKLYKNTNGEYCVTSVCFAPVDSSDNRSVFSRQSGCLLKSELF